MGKSTFTILLANWLHYALGRDVLVVDCDAPQWSIVAQRERELDVLERNDRYKLMMVRLFKRTGRKIWPVVRSTPYEGLQAARAYFAAGDREADFVRKRTGRKIWPVVRSTPEEGLQAAHAYLAAGDREADFVLLDLPGTVAAPGIFRLLARLDHLFIPLKADKLVLESALSFARAVDEQLVHNDALSSVHSLESRQAGLGERSFLCAGRR
ncbi:ParA family protein [Alistipes putredinis]|uniref:ParA family protein n=1 Tax=Alistipes putredinis TaxID=28117 RepID=UPI00033F8E47|nr:aTPase involved in chromosome partitioning [Alistipes putredinis CAG:67]